jgi:uncharacterized protein (TIGR02284 family)
MKDNRTSQTDRDDVVSTLNSLIETCKDGANGFRTAADGVEDASLKRLFSSYAEQRSQFAAELERLVTSLGADPADTGHVAGAMHRGWINLKAAITGKDDGAVISEAERGEDFAKERYQAALEKILPTDVRAAVERQYMQVKEAHDHVRALERTYSRK